MKKIMLAAALLIILAIGAYFLFLNSENSETNNSWEYAKLKPGELIMLVSATGVVKPNFEVEVKSKASGEIIKFPLEEGDSVEAGTLMVELDKSDEKRNYRQAEAGLTSAQARYRQAQVDLKLEKKEYEVSLKNARSELDSAKSTRDTMKKKLDRLAELR
ncbi:MAG: efflux RND transporter periplasmic adaptor subunit, partial [Planctomycetes bacterium]|nr:efflux RND transporter periplasmic adaptor subunit [Planctomycetota bacterium]